ncbi:hypothetical protein [Nonlabens spongiae]|nr:hypothetical protein [Nonlabens spongiae]
MIEFPLSRKREQNKKSRGYQTTGYIELLGVSFVKANSNKSDT